MYAIIEDGGRQLKVELGQVINVDFRDLPKGAEIRFEKVLALSEDGQAKIGQPSLADVRVVGRVLGPVLGPKLVIQKFRRRKNYRRKRGHRQLYTQVEITALEMPGGQGAGALETTQAAAPDAG